MKNKILLLLLFILTFCTIAVYANDDIKVFNNGAYVAFSNPPVFVNDVVMAPAEDLINARDGWATTYYPESKILCGYFKRGSSVVFTAGQNTCYYKDAFGNYTYYEFSEAPREINGVLYIPVRGYYENIYNYIVEWKESEKEVFTYLYKGTPAHITSDDGIYDFTIENFETTYVEEGVFPGEFEVHYVYSGVRTKGRVGKMYAHLYDENNNYLKSLCLAMRTSDKHDEFKYANNFHIPKEAKNIYFSFDKVTPTGDPVVFWKNMQN